MVGARLLGTWLGLKLTAGGCYTPRPGAPLTVLKFRVSFLENPGGGLCCSSSLVLDVEASFHIAHLEGQDVIGGKTKQNGILSKFLGLFCFGWNFFLCCFCHPLSLPGLVA